MEKLVTDTKAVSQNGEMVPVYHSSKKIETTDRFFLESLTSVNYDTYTAIYELFDNSVDGGATKIELIYDRKTSTLIMKDNGCGMSLEQLCNNMNLGCNRIYESDEIGYFGMGMKTSTLNLLNSENANVYSAIEIVTNNGIEKTKLIWEPLTNVRNLDVYRLPMDSELGTTITIHNCVSFHPSVLKKNVGVVFYPTLKNGNVQIFINDDEVIGTDPLYRNSDKTQTNFVETDVKGETINITAVSIDSLEEQIPWDGKKGDDDVRATDSTTDSFSFKKYGCFVIYGGRYIEIGGTTLGTRLFDSWYSRCRIEFTIPKTLTTHFGINFNKTYGLKIDKQKMPDMFAKVGDLFAWGRAKRNQENKVRKQSISIDEEKENQDISKALNKSAVNAGFQAPETGDKKKRRVEFESDPNKPGKDKSKDKQPTRARVIEKKLYEFKFEPFETGSVFWKLTFENNLFVIYINTSHQFYRRIYSNLPKESKLGFQQLLASMAQTQYRIDSMGVSSDDEFFWDTYWSDVSLHLMKIMNN
jgi:hypothetical protein